MLFKEILIKIEYFPGQLLYAHTQELEYATPLLNEHDSDPAG